MEILVAYLLEMILSLAVLSIGFLLLKTRFSQNSDSSDFSQKMEADSEKSNFGLVFMGPISEKELFSRIHESSHLIEKGAELFFFIEQPFVFTNQMPGVHIILPGEHKQKAHDLLSLCARHACKRPDFLVLLNPKLNFTEQLWQSVVEHLDAGFDFFELHAVNPFLMDEFAAEQKSNFRNFLDLFYSKFIKSQNSLAHQTIVISSKLFDYVPGKALSHLNTKFLPSESFELDLDAVDYNYNSHSIDLEKYFQPNFKLAYDKFLVQLNWSIFLGTISHTISSKFSNVLFRSLSITLILLALGLSYTDKIFFENPTVFYYLTWISVFVYSFILLAESFKTGSRSVVASFSFKRVVKHQSLNF